MQAPVLKLGHLDYFFPPYVQPELPIFQCVTTGLSDAHCASRQSLVQSSWCAPHTTRGCGAVPRGTNCTSLLGSPANWLGMQRTGHTPARGQAFLSCTFLAHPALLTKVTFAGPPTSTCRGSICFCCSCQLCGHSNSLLHGGASLTRSYLGGNHAVC